jgi:hypothetical protein
MKSASQFLPSGPTPLASEEWEDDYNQVRVLGKTDSAVRTPAQTEIGLFWTEHTGQQYARAFGYLAANHNLSVEESARFFAILWTGYADSVIGCASMRVFTMRIHSKTAEFSDVELASSSSGATFGGWTTIGTAIAMTIASHTRYL